MTSELSTILPTSKSTANILLGFAEVTWKKYKPIIPSNNGLSMSIQWNNKNIQQNPRPSSHIKTTSKKTPFRAAHSDDFPHPRHGRTSPCSPGLSRPKFVVIPKRLENKNMSEPTNEYSKMVDARKTCGPCVSGVFGYWTPKTLGMEDGHTKRHLGVLKTFGRLELDLLSAARFGTKKNWRTNLNFSHQELIAIYLHKNTCSKKLRQTGFAKGEITKRFPKASNGLRLAAFGPRQDSWTFFGDHQMHCEPTEAPHLLATNTCLLALVVLVVSSSYMDWKITHLDDFA